LKLLSLIKIRYVIEIHSKGATCILKFGIIVFEKDVLCWNFRSPSVWHFTVLLTRLT